ncbi:MAG TPA: FAD:protein FMN transferase [Terriglobales bacterium]|jgi:thiamine biosynthesis lipoprotein|nr:FAD:protein FMN transferase [Terriglobales bacterium]
MGTTFSIYLYSSDRESASVQFDAAFDEIERVEEALSNYRPTSELSRINRLASKQRVTTDPEVFRVLQSSIEYSRRTGGAFDITVGPLMRAWGFFRANGRYPTAVELSQARAKIGWSNVELDNTGRTITFRAPGMELDLGGIGKGYAVDQVITVLRQAAVTSALIDAGSSTLYALGAPPGKSGWKVIVPKPGQRSQAVSSVFLRDASLSTSGSYEKFFRLNGRTYCHIMDPRTGQPVQGMLQTTVIAPTATDSDALSTAMFVMGPAAGRRFLPSVPNTSAVWVEGTLEHPRIEQWRWPTVLCRQNDDCTPDRKDEEKP